MEQNRDIYILGAGGHGKVIAELAIACGYTLQGFIDIDTSKQPFGKPTITLESYLKIAKHATIALAIGNNHVREKLYKELKSLHLSIATLIHPSSIVSTTALIKEGTVILANALIHTDTIIQIGTIINSGAIIEHDNTIGAFSHISPGACLAGEVSIGEKTHIGIGSTVIQQITIGANSIIGAGSVVIKDLPDKITAVGNPAKVIKTHE